MTVRRFLSQLPVIDGMAHITGEELHHLRTVNRAQVGDIVEVTDGRGTLFKGAIGMVNQREALVRVTETTFREKNGPTIIIAPSLTKKRAMSVMVEKLAEMGVDEIRPLLFARTDEVYSDSMLRKWERIAFQALKVNKKLWATGIHRPQALAEFIKEEPAGLRLLLDIEGKAGIPGHRGESVLAVVGPPGGILDEERLLMLENGFHPVTISDCILKTETASLSIAAILKNDVGGKIE